MVVATAHERRTARCAEGEDDERIAKPETLGRDSVQVRRLKPRVARLVALLTLHDAQRVPALIVGVDEEEVRFARRCSGGRNGEGEGERREQGWSDGETANSSVHGEVFNVSAATSRDQSLFSASGRA